MAINDVGFDLDLSIKGFQQSLNKVDKGLNNFHKDFKKQAKSSSAAWSSFVGNISANAISFAARGLVSLTSSMTDFAKVSVLAAVAAQETASKFEAVFSSIAQESEEVAKALQKNYGLGVTESKTLLSATGDLLTGFGFTQEGALELSKEVQQMAVDLASFTNFSGGAQGASEAITKALLGETESMKSLGVSISQTAVAAQVLVNKQKGLTFRTNQQAKAQATLDLIMKQSKNATGDYAKTSGGAANQLKLLNTRIEDLKISIGDKLIPVLEPMIAFMIDWIETNDDLIAQKLEDTITDLSTAFNFLRENSEELIKSAKILVKGLTGLLALGTLVKTVDLLTKAFIGLKVAFIALNGPLGLVLGGLGLVAAAIASTFGTQKIDLAGQSVKKLKSELSEATKELQIQEKVLKVTGQTSSLAYEKAAQRVKFLREKIKEVETANKSTTKSFKEVETAGKEAADKILDAWKPSADFIAAYDEFLNNTAQKTHDTNVELEAMELEHNERLNEINTNNVAALVERDIEDKIAAVDREKAANLAKLADLKDTNKKKLLEQQISNKASLAIAKINKKNELDLESKVTIASNKLKTKQAQIDARFAQNQVGLIANTANLVNAIAGEQTEAGFFLSKAAAVGQALLAHAQATASIPVIAANTASAAGPAAAGVFTATAASLKGIITANTALSLAAIAATTIRGPSFQHGGIVPGSSFSGDNVGVNVNSSEMILNRGQQAQLFNLANNGGGNSGDVVAAINNLGNRIENMEIILQADDNEIARSTSRGTQNGIIIGESR